MYCARPGPILPRSLVKVGCSRSMGLVAGRLAPCPDATRRTRRRACRQARCSSIVPVYSSGISQPPNGTILAPSARWTRVERRPASSATIRAQRRLTTSISPSAEWYELRVDFVLHAGQREHVEHSLAALEDVDQFVAVGEDDRVAVDHEMGGSDVGGDVLAQVLKTSRTDSSLIPASSRVLMTRSSSRSL